MNYSWQEYYVDAQEDPRKFAIESVLRPVGRALFLPSAAGLLLLLSACVNTRSAATATSSVPRDPAQLEAQLAAQVNQFVQSDRAAPPAACQVLFVGSSSIVFWRSLENDMAPLPVINRGFGGSNIEHINRWFDQIVAPYRPRSIVFYAGENDLSGALVNAKPPREVIKDFDQFMALKAKALGDTPVYFISVKPSKRRFEKLALQGEVNDVIRARADKRADLHFINVVPLMLQDGAPKDLFVSDGLHMNEKGYALWTQAVRAALIPDNRLNEQRCHQRSKSR